MRGDFSRLSFRRGRHYVGVLLQQGRVTVDADFANGDKMTSPRSWWSFHPPTWTDFNDHDPGVTLVELFAFLAETLLELIDEINEQQSRRRRRWAFLDVGTSGLGILWMSASAHRKCCATNE